MEQIKYIKNSLPIISENCYYDIFGDIHGNADALIRLLTKLNYNKIDGVWQHNTRKAIFVGDFINRGKQNKLVLKIIKKMVDNNYAYAVLGNHELYAIYHLTLKKKKPIIKISSSNIKVINELTKEFKDDKELLADYIKWLRTLPLHLDFGRIRVAHAYWNKYHANLIHSNRKKGRFKKSTLIEMGNINTPLGRAVYETTKGIEFNLPKDLLIKDSNNNKRSKFRIKWWKKPLGKTFHELSFGNKFKLPNYTIPNELLFSYQNYNPNEPIVFFGHYCIHKTMQIPQQNLCCVDSCAAGNGQLSVYRWSGEKKLSYENLVYDNNADS